MLLFQGYPQTPGFGSRKELEYDHLDMEERSTAEIATPDGNQRSITTPIIDSSDIAGDPSMSLSGIIKYLTS